MYIVILILLFAAVAFSQAPKRVKPYVKKNGTLVQPHIRTKQNKTRLDNYSTKGNVNPSTGKKGTKPVVPKPTPKRRSK